MLVLFFVGLFFSISKAHAAESYKCVCYSAVSINNSINNTVIVTDKSIESSITASSEYSCNVACKKANFSNIPGKSMYYEFGTGSLKKTGDNNGKCTKVTDCKNPENPLCNTTKGICVNEQDATSTATIMAGDQINGQPAEFGSGTGPPITSNRVPGESTGGGLIQCGRPGTDMCTLCDIIKGMNIIIQYLMKIAIGVALLAMSIGGVMYVISAGDSGLIDTGKNTMKNAAIGFVIIFAGYLIINTTINYLGTKKGATGEATFGMNITSWGNFDCTANPNR